MGKAKKKYPGDMMFDAFVKRASKLTILPDQPLIAEQIKKLFKADPFNFRYKLGPIYDILRFGVKEDESDRLPTAILITGDWGTGKTTAMKWLEVLLNEWNKEKPAEIPEKDYIKVRPVWFYPWKYDNKKDVRRGLIAEVIINAVYIRNPGNKKITITRKKMLTGLKLLGSFGLDVVSDLAAASEYEIPAIPGLKISGEALKKIREHYNQAAHPEAAFLNELEEAMKHWVRESLGKNQRMVIFIDDLDRCMPEIALQVLEALKLYLNIPNLIFVLGVDQKVIEKLVIEHYKKLGLVKERDKDREETEPKREERLQAERKARQYLSKMFQVEVELEPTEQQISDFFEQQLTQIPYWEDRLSDLEQELFRDLVLKFSGRNPREIKRLLNSALIAGAGPIMIKQDDLNFNQGLQLFFVRKILDERYKMVLDIGSKRGIEFFVQWSRIICEGKTKDERFPLTMKISDDVRKKISQIHQESQEISQLEGVDNPKLVEALLNEAKRADLDLQFVPKEYLRLLSVTMFCELFHFLADGDLGRLMQIPFSQKLAEFTSRSTLFISPAPAVAVASVGQPTVVITDKRYASKDYIIIRNAVARQLYKNPVEVVEEDYTNIHFLNLSGTGISDLNVLGMFTGLTNLDLSDTSVSDLLALEALQSLQVLRMSNAQIRDLEPLRNLEKLQRLNVYRTEVANIEPLGGLENLTLLGLADTKVGDLRPLRNLKKLSWLDVRNTQVTDLEPIGSLSSLRSLFISGVKVTSLESLFNLKELLVISISGDQYKDLSFLTNLPSLRDLALVGSEVHDLTGIQHGTNIKALELADTIVTDLQCLKELPRLGTLTFTRTPVLDIESLKELKTLEILNLFGTDLTDHQEDELRKALPKLAILKGAQ